LIHEELELVITHQFPETANQFPMLTSGNVSTHCPLIIVDVVHDELLRSQAEYRPMLSPA
jgi:hypothetical protein